MKTVEMLKEMGYSLKSVKYISSRSESGFETTLMFGKTKVAHFYDDGWGGPIIYDLVHNKPLFDTFFEDCKKLPKWDCNGEMIHTDYEIAISDLVNDYEKTKAKEKEIKRLIKNYVFFFNPNGGYTRFKITEKHSRELLTNHVKANYPNVVIYGAA